MLTSTLPRWEGDAEPRFVLDLARELNTEFAIELLAPHARGAATRECLEGVPVRRFRYWWPRWEAAAYQGGMVSRIRENPFRVLQLPFFFGALLLMIVRRLRCSPRVDLIHAHWLIPQGLAALVARVLANRCVPILCTSHGGDLFGLRGPMLTRLKQGILRRCDAITVVSRPMAQQARQIVPGLQPRVIPMGTDLRERFIPPPDDAVRDPTHLLFVGRLVPKKGLEYLLDALAQLRRENVPFSAEIVGYGPLEKQLVEKSRLLGLTECVRFAGPASHAHLPGYYQRAGIAVFPFVEADDGDQEGLGLVMVEAMGCGCAVIASDLPAVRDVIRHEETGVLVAPGNMQALADALRWALHAPHCMSRISERGRGHVLRTLDWAITGDKFRDIYQSLLDDDAGKSQANNLFGKR
ncbi:glycosyltransferase family 4 protein [Thiohalocapsa marina]|uniref:Glycosyltransferase family 4 protein n=2 Tax=Thiohalocapsa marina TaxID=424902 RepID=A0A5M8FK49_9GAMM|nr:glycosyltransferase [Thiohalocapsa marina]KAA6184864.1 glycosyltransferase family 4 protein [Thiohalocapsa marina]